MHFVCIPRTEPGTLGIYIKYVLSGYLLNELVFVVFCGQQKDIL